MSKLLETRAAAWTSGSAYTYPDHRQKELTHSAARAALRKLPAALGTPAGAYDIRTNKAGMAVTGETTLHMDNLYVQICSASSGPNRLQIMYRTCNGRRDYSGGRNHFAPLSALADGSLVAALRQLLNHGERP